MDSSLVLIVVLVAATPFLALAAFVMSMGARKQLRGMEQRLVWIERHLAEEVRAVKPIAAPPPQPQAQPVAQSEPDSPPPAPEEIAVAPSAPEPSPAPPPSAQPKPSVEEWLGARWAVWVGGLALALGGVFLVRYSIEQGLLGPGVRVALGGLLAMVLIAAGEWMRRSENRRGLAGIPAAHIPSILTAAGTIVAFATVYAAYALYGFIGPAIAFLALGAVALLTLLAALLHGPALAAVGVLGAYVTPALVAAETPNWWALYVYLAVVTAAAYAQASVRLWRWLAYAATLFAFMWGTVGLNDPAVASIAAHAFHVTAGFGLALLFLAPGLLFGPKQADGPDPVSSVALGAFLLNAALLVIAQAHDGLPLFVFVALIAATAIAALRTEAIVAAVPAAAALAALVIADWAVGPPLPSFVAPGVETAGLPFEPRTQEVIPHLALGAGLAALFGVMGFRAQGHYGSPIAPILWATAATAGPIAILVALYYGIAGFERSVPFALIALALSASYALATERLMRSPARPGIGAASAMFATACLAALALGLTFAMEKGWLTIALALTALASAYVSTLRPLPALRWLAAALALIVLARIVWDPRIVGDEIGDGAIFNWLLWGYGVPALSFWMAGWLMRRRADDLPLRIVEALAILFTVLLVGLEIRHFVQGGNVYAFRSGLAEAGLQAAAALALVIGLERIRARSGSAVHLWGANILSAVALTIVIAGLLIIENPLFTGESVGGRYVNLLLLAYALPAALAACLAWIARDRRPRWFTGGAAATSLVLALTYVTLTVRRLFQGPELTGITSDAEWYAYSAVWLGFGVALLLAGLVFRSQPARIASAAVIVLTVGKVFLSDMANLEGALRALSLLGLGVVLIGIGWLYQRLLAPPPAPTPT